MHEAAEPFGTHSRGTHRGALTVAAIAFLGCSSKPATEVESKQVPLRILVQGSWSSVDQRGQVAAGIGFSCAITADRRVKCWGNDYSGQLGSSATSDKSLYPVYVDGLTGIDEISSAGAHTCARRSDGTVACWGYNGWGEIGSGDYSSHPTPVDVVGLSGAVELASGMQHTCARLADNTVKCWGSNASGQLGIGSSFDDIQLSPVAVAIDNVVDLSAGTQHTCAVRADQTVWCWGANGGGQLGQPSGSNVFLPRQVAGVSGASKVTGGAGHTCVLGSNGSVMCWGATASYVPQFYAQQPTTLVAGGATLLESGDDWDCALVGGRLMCWGSNLFGQIGPEDGNLP